MNKNNITQRTNFQLLRTKWKKKVKKDIILWIKIKWDPFSRIYKIWIYFSTSYDTTAILNFSETFAL